MDKLIPQWWRGAEASKWACHIFRVHIGYSTFFSQPNYYFWAMIIFLFYPGRPIRLVSLGLQSRLPHGFVNPALLKRCRKKCDYLKHKVGNILKTHDGIRCHCITNGATTITEKKYQL